MSQKEVDILKRALLREKAARKVAESILEKKAAELYEANQKLEKSFLEMEHAYTKTDSQLQGVFENIVDAYLIMDLMGNILKMNDAALQLLGFENDKVDYNLMDMVDPTDYNMVASSFKTLLKNGSITDFEILVNNNAGKKKLVHINASIIYDGDTPVAAQGIIRDITKVREHEEKLKQSEDRLATLMLNLEEGVLLEDENGKIIVANGKFCEFFYLKETPGNLKGKDSSAICEDIAILFEDAQAYTEDKKQIVSKKEPIFNQDLQTIDGRTFERDYIPIFRDGIYKGHLWKYKDFTIRRQYRQSLEAERFKYSSIISNMNLGLVEVDKDDKIVMANKSFYEMTGYTEEELLGKNGKDILPLESDRKLVEEKFKERKAGRTDSYEVRIANKRGELRYWLISGAPNYNLKGELKGSIGVIFDITDVKNLQLQKENLLKKLEKSNNELHEYAHVVSHDLKSPLRSINALVSWLKEDNKDNLDDVSLQNIAHIETTLEKMEQLITDVLEYSSIGSSASENEVVDINGLVSDLIGILHVPKHVKINIVTPLPSIQGNKIKLQQLFQNLMSNAIKFIDKEEGLIEIDFENQGTHSLFKVKDNGIGIDKKFHDKIFKIFHALNKRKDSTGIGLSIVKKIVELHEGEIWLESEPTVGTTFYFTLKN